MSLHAFWVSEEKVDRVALSAWSLKVIVQALGYPSLWSLLQSDKILLKLSLVMCQLLMLFPALEHSFQMITTVLTFQRDIEVSLLVMFECFNCISITGK